MSSSFLVPLNEIDSHQLSSIVSDCTSNVLIIDSRSFTEHNACHIKSAVNVSCSKVVKRRLQQDKLSVKELLLHTCNCDVDEKLDVIVYDQSNKDGGSLSPESFLFILLKKLQLTFRTVSILSGGLDEFYKQYPHLCDDKPKNCPPLASLSQPCLPITNQGPTRILPFLYLGSQFDVMNKELMKDCNITYALNVSTTCPQPDFLSEGHFLRIPVNDSYSEKLLPYFPQAFHFLDKARESNSCVLVHCLAGVSRSPTIAIAYVMRHLCLSSDDGYRYVKAKRPTISPNFNFLGQLLEYEKQLKNENIIEAKSETNRPSLPVCRQKRVCRTDMRNLALSLDLNSQVTENSQTLLPAKDQSPTTALAKLSFDMPKCEENEPLLPDFKQFRSKSCYGDFLRSYDDANNEKQERESHISSKILSPVKEIKCDGLISEISTGNNEISVKYKGATWQRNSRQYSRDEKQTSNLSKYCYIYETQSNVNRENVSLSLIHSSSSPQVSTFNKTNKKCENIAQNKKRSCLSFLGSPKQRWQVNDKKEIKPDFHFSDKFKHHISVVRSNENLNKTNDPELKFVSQEYSPFHINPPFVHSLSLNSNLHKLKDSYGLNEFYIKKNPNQQKLQTLGLKVDNADFKDIFVSKEVEQTSNLSDKSFLSSTVFEDKNWIKNSDYPLTKTEDQLDVDNIEPNVGAFNNNVDEN